MKEKLESLNFKHRVTLFTFALFLIIGLLSPISGDDWKAYVIGKDGIIECFKNINFADGRIISGFLVNFFSYNKLLFDIVLAFLMSEFVKICNDFMGTVKTKYMYLYPLIGVLLVSTFMFSYNYVSVTSTVTYTFPTIIFFLFFYNLLKYEEITISKLIKLILMALYICFSSIHIAIAFFISSFIYFILNKKYDLKHFIIISSELIAIVLSLINIKNGLFYSEFNTILGNISYMIENVFSSNILLIIIGAIPINIYLYQKLSENVYGRVVITLFDMILAFSLCYNFFGYSPVNLNLVLSKYNGIFATENWYYIFYFLTYMALFVISMNYFIKNRKVKHLFNSYNTGSLILIILLLISPIFDKGNIVFIMFTIILEACVLAKEMNTKVYVKIVKTVSVLLILYYVSMFGIIKYIDLTRTDYIEEQLSYQSTNIEVKANPLYLVWRYNPVDYFQIKDFKNYYEINNDSTIEVKYFGIFNKIEKKVKK